MPVKAPGGGLYNTVQERLIAAHGETAKPLGIRSIETQPIGLTGLGGAALIIVKATVTFDDGRTFSGLAEVPFGATKGPEFTNPIEVTETSAVGRALAMAGYYGSDTGLAGAEEMRTVAAKDAARTPTRAAPPPQRPTPTATKPAGPTETKASPVVATRATPSQPPKPRDAAAYYLFLASVADHWNDTNPDAASGPLDYEHPPYGASAEWFIEHGVPLKTALLALGYTKEQLIAPAS